MLGRTQQKKSVCSESLLRGMQFLYLTLSQPALGVSLLDCVYILVLIDVAVLASLRMPDHETEL